MAQCTTTYAEQCMWVSTQTCLNWLREAKPSSDRVGHLAVVGLVNDPVRSIERKIPTSLRCQVCWLFNCVIYFMLAGKKEAKIFFCSRNTVMFPS